MKTQGTRYKEQGERNEGKGAGIKGKALRRVVAAALLVVAVYMTPSSVNAANMITDVFNENFKLSACDGPEQLNYVIGSDGKFVVGSDGKYATKRDDFVPCNFRGVLIQAQHLINAMIVLGVLAAIAMFSWAGFLLIRSGPEQKNQAKDIFKNTFIGFIMMLSAWFIVYQLLDWLAANPGVKALLSN